MRQVCSDLLKSAHLLNRDTPIIHFHNIDQSSNTVLSKVLVHTTLSLLSASYKSFSEKNIYLWNNDNKDNKEKGVQNNQNLMQPFML